jgi:hypothetical protein
VSRYRITYGDALRERLMYGPMLVEPVGFMMDRRMLLGVKERAERPASSTSSSAERTERTGRV